MKKKFQAMVLSCIDPRFQPLVYNYLKKLHIKSIYIFVALLLSEVVFGKILADFNIPHLFQALHLVFALVAFGVLVNLFLNLKISK